MIMNMTQLLSILLLIIILQKLKTNNRTAIIAELVNTDYGDFNNKVQNSKTRTHTPEVHATPKHRMAMSFHPCSIWCLFTLRGGLL